MSPAPAGGTPAPSTLHDHRFEGVIKVYEQQLVDIVVKVVNLVGKDEIGGTIVAYMLVHPGLTQEQIHELTGFSKGSISTHLQAMVARGFATKRLVPGTHTNLYTLVHIGHATRGKMRMAEGVIRHMTRYLARTRDIAASLPVEGEAVSKDIFLARIAGFETFWEIYTRAVHEMADVVETQFAFEPAGSPDESPTENALDPLPEITPLKPIPDGPGEWESVEALERDLVKMFGRVFYNFGFTKAYAKLLGAFLFRGRFTQKQLRLVTRLSAGSVSKELGDLERRGLITRVKAEGRAHYAYELVPLKQVYHVLFVNPTRVVVEFTDTLQRMRRDLDRNAGEWQLLNGYAQLYTALVQFMGLMPAYEKFRGILEGELARAVFPVPRATSSG